MVAREKVSNMPRCPGCGNKLAREQDLFRCDEHGAFFTYGPQLLVRVPRQGVRQPVRLMPWENRGTRNSW